MPERLKALEGQIQDLALQVDEVHGWLSVLKGAVNGGSSGVRSIEKKDVGYRM